MLRSTIQVKVQELDTEWVRLIQAARSIGLSMEEVQLFLKMHSQGKSNRTNVTEDSIRMESNKL